MIDICANYLLSLDNLSEIVKYEDLMIGDNPATSNTYDIDDISKYQFISFNVAQDVHYNTGFPIVSTFSDTERRKFVIDTTSYKDIAVRCVVDFTVLGKVTISIDKTIQYSNVFGIGELRLIGRR